MISSCSYLKEIDKKGFVASSLRACMEHAMHQRSGKDRIQNFSSELVLPKIKLGHPAFTMKITVVFEFLYTEMTSWCLLMMLDRNTLRTP